MDYIKIVKGNPNPNIIKNLEMMITKAKDGRITNLVVLFDDGEESGRLFELISDDAVIKFIGLLEVAKTKLVNQISEKRVR